MAVWEGPVVYVHGAGQQEHPALMKRRLDGLIFGEPLGPRSRLAYYADLFHEVGPLPAGLEGRGDPVSLAARPDTPRPVLARALAGVPGNGGLEAAVDPRVKLAEALLAQADRIAPPEAPAGLEGRRFFDTGFRIVVSLLARDVIHYLFDGAAEAMRAPLREALADLTAPTLVIAHSLGTIVTYDVLTSAAYHGPAEIKLLTLGCPLGVENVQDHLRDDAGRPHPVPRPVTSWTNIADPRDPVAAGQALAGEFSPFDFIRDDLTADNRSPIHHDLVEYLRVPAVLEVLGAA